MHRLHRLQSETAACSAAISNVEELSGDDDIVPRRGKLRGQETATGNTAVSVTYNPYHIQKQSLPRQPNTGCTTEQGTHVESTLHLHENKYLVP